MSRQSLWTLPDRAAAVIQGLQHEIRLRGAGECRINTERLNAEIDSQRIELELR